MPTQALPQTAKAYSDAQRLEAQAAVAAVLRQWRRMGKDFDTSWARIAPTVVGIVSTAQERMATGAVAYIPAVLEETGQTAAISPVAQTNVSALVGVTGSGLQVADAISFAPIRAKEALTPHIFTDGDVTKMLPGLPISQALDTAGRWLSSYVGTILSDTARTAESLGTFTRPVSGYVRMLNPPSCGRCVILAGRWYSKSSGFPRHPNCDCRHIPASESVADDLTVNPQEYFDSLDAEGQAKLAGSAANAQAVRDGADLGQLVNAYRRTAGMKFAQVRAIKTNRRGDKFTLEGTTRRGRAAQQQVGLRRNGAPQARLMPESIYATAKNREDALRLLNLYGWITDEPARRRGHDIFTEQRRLNRNERARERRAEGRAAEAKRNPAAVAAGASGGNPPRRPGNLSAGAPDPDDKSAWDAYWKARQDALGIDTRGEILKPDEVLFVERFKAAGQELEWIPTGANGKDPAGFLLPTSDFIWLNNGGLVTELKSPQSATYRAIKNRIHTALTAAGGRGVSKTNFVIDLGDKQATAALRASLSKYNQRHPGHPLSRLWVLARGDLVEIDLT